MPLHHAHDPPPLRPLRDLFRVAAVAVAITACAGASGMQGPGPAVVGAPPFTGTGDYGDSLREPLVVRSVNGVLSATLDVVMADLSVTRSGAIGPDTVIRDSVTTDTILLRAYRLAATTDPAYGPDDARFTPRFPGPTFRVRPGELVQIWLRNKLPPPTSSSESNDACMSYPAANLGRDSFQDCLHGPNYTNIHYHGMHVTPDSNSTVVGDDVLMAIAPGDSILYSFRIPMNQSPGTHWYHPHKHGSVALQVANGMSGAFIVEDPTSGLDRFTREHTIPEHLIAIQQIDTAVGLLYGDKTNILDKVPPLVNGQDYPVIYMAPGEVQRWRIVNENVTSATKTLEFRFEDQTGQEPVVVEVARDGVQYAAVNIAQGNDSLLLVAAGNRLDVLVRAPDQPGTHRLLVRHVPGASRQTRSRPRIPVQTSLGNNSQFLGNNYRVFQVVVDSSLTPRSTGLPASISDFAGYLGANIPAPRAFLGGRLAGASDTAVIVFTDTAGPGNDSTPTQFFLGSAQNPWQRFNDAVVFVPSDEGGTPLPMLLDSTQTWKIVNLSPNQINHPFHIHINPFQVDSVYAPNTADPYYALFQELNAASRQRNSPIWLDVLPLPIPTTAPSGAIVDTPYVFITQRYDNFEGCTDARCGPPTGQFVMHCHILGHEERGMMQVLQISDSTGGGVTRVRGNEMHHAVPATGQGGGAQGTGQGQGRQTPPGAHPHRH